MKKILNLVLGLLCCFVLAGCSCKKFDKIELSEECYLQDEAGRLEDVNYSELQDLLDNNKSILVFVHESTCSSCRKFTPIITKYSEDNHLLVYRISIQDLSENKALKEKVNHTPGILIFKDGELEIEYDGLSDKSADVFSTDKGWKEWVESKIVVK